MDTLKLACVSGDSIVRIGIHLLLLNDPLLSLGLVQEVSDVLSLLDLGDARGHLLNLLLHIERLSLWLFNGLSLLDRSRFGLSDRCSHLDRSLLSLRNRQLMLLLYCLLVSSDFHRFIPDVFTINDRFDRFLLEHLLMNSFNRLFHSFFLYNILYLFNQSSLVNALFQDVGTLSVNLFGHMFRVVPVVALLQRQVMSHMVLMRPPSMLLLLHLLD